MNPWEADIHLSIDSAHALVREHFPAFAQSAFELLSSGWDNNAYLADGKVVFRFPRRKVAATLIENEIRILPLIEREVPLPISVSRYVGSPTTDYPFTWAGYDLLPGTTACRLDWTDEERAANAKTIAAFLRALHRIPVDEEVRQWAPRDELARTDMQHRLPKLLERLAEMPNILPTIDAKRVKVIAVDLARSAIRDPRSEILAWVHGDLYARHILADENKKINGVIDWGDVHLGDIAGDLSIAWTFLPLPAHRNFRDAYGPIDDATWIRAKFRAIAHAATIAEYGVGIGDPDLPRAAQFCFDSILKGS